MDVNILIFLSKVILPKEKLRRGRLGTLTFVTRDQYGESVMSPSLVVWNLHFETNKLKLNLKKEFHCFEM